MISYGDIGVFSIGDAVVNKLVPGYVEIERRPGGFGMVNIYFEIPGGDWYFFTYRNYIMQVISSNEGFNTEVLNMGEGRRILYSKDEDRPYEFMVSSRRKMIDFVRKMEEIHR
jgi:3-methyladenine DNA glycosylase Mpg